MRASNGKHECTLLATRLHDNPLFAADFTADVMEPRDQLGYSSDECKENACSLQKKQLSDRASSKRVLGERNHEELPRDAAEAGPPKSIRAVQYPCDTGTFTAYRGDELSPTSFSTSSSSESELCTPRFTLSPQQKFPEHSDDGSSDGTTYDPRENLRSSRPRFLRYRPDWRLQLISSLEFTEADQMTEPQAECSTTTEDRGIDAENNPEQLVDNGDVSEGEGKLNNDTVNAAEAVEELEAVKEQVVQEQARSTGAKTLVMEEFEAIGNAVEALRGFLPESLAKIDVQEQDIYEWDWFGEYGTNEAFQGGHLASLVDSEDFAALLTAIMFGTEQEIRDSYLAYMDFVELGYDNSLEELFDFSQGGKHPKVTSEPSAADPDDDDSREQIEIVGKQVQEHINKCKASLGVSIRPDEALPTDIFFNDTFTADLKSEVSWAEEHLQEQDHLDFKLPSACEVAVLLTSILSIKAFLAYRSMLMRKRASNKKRLAEVRATATAVTSAPERPKLLEDLLEETFSDVSRESSYGSFTAYIVSNEGVKNEQVTLTPVRRSSRIRAQSPTRAAKRRVLLSP